MNDLYQIVYYCPPEALEPTKAALFRAGAGKTGDGCYEECCWQVEGEGQFRPLPGSRPATGTPGKLERLREFRVELVCRKAFLDEALKALGKAHPYEEPVCCVWKIDAGITASREEGRHEQ